MQTPGPGGEPQGTPGDGELPESPLSAIGMGAAQLHEMYLGFVEAGFTPPQALHLVTAMFIEMMRQAGS